jgi:hypothetical protein
MRPQRHYDIKPDGTIGRVVHPEPERQFLRIGEGCTARCAHCGERVTLDVTEGGGDPTYFGAWDWGTRDRYGMDYGCSDSPETDAEGTGGHSPIWGTIQGPVG